MDKLIQIGTTTRVQGATGRIKARVEPRYWQSLPHAEFIFINLDGKPVPFFVEALGMDVDVFFKLEGVDSPQAALPLTAKALFLRKNDLLSNRKSGDPRESLGLLSGYNLFGTTEGLVGRIREVVEYPQQLMAIVITPGGSEKLIPLHESLVQRIDTDRCEITLALPDGILDL